MKLTAFLVAGLLFCASCATQKHSLNSPSGNAASSTGATPAVAAGTSSVTGSSFEHAVVITETSESKGIAAEYQWVRENYPGSTVLGQSLQQKDKHVYDVLKVQTKGGGVKNVYFDITGFFGKF